MTQSDIISRLNEIRMPAASRVAVLGLIAEIQEAGRGPSQTPGARRQRRWRERQTEATTVTEGVTRNVTRNSTRDVTPPSPSPLSPDPSPHAPTPAHTHSAGAHEAPVTLTAAMANAGQAGVSREVAEQWWLSRQATGWRRGVAGTRVLNWQADLKSFAASYAQNAADRPRTVIPMPAPVPTADQPAWMKPSADR